MKCARRTLGNESHQISPRMGVAENLFCPVSICAAVSVAPVRGLHRCASLDPGLLLPPAREQAPSSPGAILRRLHPGRQRHGRQIG